MGDRLTTGSILAAFFTGGVLMLAPAARSPRPFRSHDEPSAHPETARGDSASFFALGVFAGIASRTGGGYGSRKLFITLISVENKTALLSNLLQQPGPLARGSRQPRTTWPRTLRRAIFLVPAGFALLAGLDAALILLGVAAPVTTTRLPQVHGMLMVFGFVGTLVSLERAVALRLRLGYFAPALLGLGGLLLLAPVPMYVGKLVLLAGAAAFVAVYVPLWRRQRDDAVLIQTFGAVLAACALTLWLGGVEVPVLTPWLAGFVILTIGGERLELARMTMGTRAARDLLTLSAILVMAIATSLLWPPIGYPVLGLALLAFVIWLAIHDVARLTIRSTGLPRFAAGCLLAGYFWLAVAAITWLIGGAAFDGARYDTILHAVFLGFTISMIMAHAPVILPAVLRQPLPYHPAMIVPAVLLHLSLVVRVWLGDALQLQTAWQIGGVLNITALLLFIVVTAWSALRRNSVVSERSTATVRNAE